MAPPARAPCQICASNASKYTCSRCMLLYCSLPCYKQHQESSCANTASVASNFKGEDVQRLEKREEDDGFLPDPPLRPLTALNWPYIPDQSAYPDPLKRDDPKMLQLDQYEAIATSSAIRTILSESPNLKNIVRAIDRLRGNEREEALQRALGVSLATRSGIVRDSEVEVGEEDVLALRRLAEAIEGAVRGGNEGALGLDWGD